VAVRVLATRVGQCKCGRKISMRTIATDVKDSIPVELSACPGCDRIR
jgi:hypothetical protein